MKEGSRVGIVGVGPGSIDVASSLPNTTVFRKAGARELRSVYTTSVGYEQLFDAHVPSEALSPMTSLRLITAQGSDFRVNTGPGYYMLDYPAVLAHWEERLNISSNISVETLPAATRPEDIRVREKDGEVVLDVFGGRYEFDAVIDATGVPAILASQMETKRANEEYIVEYMYFGTFKGTMPEAEMTLIFGVAGGTSWANKSVYRGDQGEELIDIVFSGWGYNSFFDTFKNGEGRERLGHLARFLSGVPEIQIHDAAPVHVTTGMIRSQRIPTPTSKHIYPTGEAAGTAKPISGESFNRALRSGQLAAHAVTNEVSPAEYHRLLRKEWKGNDLLFAHALHVIENQVRNDQGGQIDAGYRLFQGNKIDERFVKQVEDFIIRGRLPLSLLIQLSRSPEFRKSMRSVLRHLGKVKLFGEERAINPRWSYAPLNTGD